MLLQMALFYSFLWLNSIPLCVCMFVCVCMCVCVYMCVYIYIYIYICHIFFIHSSVDGHLDCCFCVLAIVSSAAINIGVHVSFRISFLQIYFQEWDYWIIWQLYF